MKKKLKEVEYVLSASCGKNCCLYWLMNNVLLRLQPAFADGLIVLARRKA
jgi:hypothetical protein